MLGNPPIHDRRGDPVTLEASHLLGGRRFNHTAIVWLGYLERDWERFATGPAPGSEGRTPDGPLKREGGTDLIVLVEPVDAEGSVRRRPTGQPGGGGARWQRTKREVGHRAAPADPPIAAMAATAPAGGRRDGGSPRGVAELGMPISGFRKKILKTVFGRRLRVMGTERGGPFEGGRAGGSPLPPMFDPNSRGQAGPSHPPERPERCPVAGDHHPAARGGAPGPATRPYRRAGGRGRRPRWEDTNTTNGIRRTIGLKILVR